MQTLLPSLEEKRGQFPLERVMRVSFPKSEKISGFTTTLVQADLGGDVPLSSCLGVSRERSPNSGKRRHTEVAILRQTFYEWTAKLIPKSEKVDACSLHHLK